MRSRRRRIKSMIRFEINLRSNGDDDLEQHIITLQAKGNEIVLMIDANESLTDRGSKLKELASTCNLTSVHEHLHADLPPPATYSRGSSKIDFILISENLLPACRRCGIEPIHAGVVSDHLALFMDRDQVVALQGPLNTIAPASGRVLQCSKVKFVEKYIEVLDQQLEKQYYYQRLASLMLKGTRQSFTQSMHSEAEILTRPSEKPCSTPRNNATHASTTKTGHLSSLSEDSRSNSGKFYCLAGN